MRRFISLIVSVIIFLTSITPVNAFYTNMNASVVVGKNNFTSTSGNLGSITNFSKVFGVASDGTKLVAPDYNCNRVFIWNHIPQTNGVSPDVIIGGPDLNSCIGGSTAANRLWIPTQPFIYNGKLLISDDFNNRVLIFNQIPTSNNASADVVIGQADFITQGSGGISQFGLQHPLGVFVDSATGKLFVTDNLAHRILIYNQIPTSNLAAADVVLGQADFTHGTANRGGSVDANTLKTPDGSSLVIGSKLLVLDAGNHRVLIWNSIPTTNGQPADVVIGQPDFTHNSVNQGGSIGPNTLNFPTGLGWNGKQLFVSDYGNNRILIFNGIPTTNNASADLVLGQADFTHGSANQGGTVGPNTFSEPNNIQFSNNQMIVAEELNNRLLIFNNVLSNPVMNINSPTTNADKIRIAGNVSLGERPNYSMQKVIASVNGENESNVTYLDGGRDNGPGNTLYEFYNDFLPTVRGGDANNYTVAFRAQSFNAEEDKRFYFAPFSLDKVTLENMPTISFTVNQTFRDQLKNNLTKYQIYYKKDKDINWKLYIDNIAVDSENNGNITLRATAKLTKGTYQLQVRAINTMGREQGTNNLNIKIKK